MPTQASHKASPGAGLVEHTTHMRDTKMPL